MEAEQEQVPDSLEDGQGYSDDPGVHSGPRLDLRYDEKRDGLLPVFSATGDGGGSHLRQGLAQVRTGGGVERACENGIPNLVLVSYFSLSFYLSLARVVCPCLLMKIVGCDTLFFPLRLVK